ncbi:ZIP family metal transporter [Candidatus Woesearchaeota archaeon]|nr:ZIP family metal transporter [Candidatus Woesearchaeota archaeon]
MDNPTLTIFLYTLVSVVIVSLISLIGIFFLTLTNIKKIKVVLFFMVSVSAGALLGDAFIHLLPEAVEKAGFTLEVSGYVLSGIVIFFIVEKWIHWEHYHLNLHKSKKHPHSFALMNLMGDALHNFIDGLAIGASYLISIEVGIATTIAIILHEIPQEISDFGVLIHGGFTKMKALAFNLMVATTAILGAIISIFVGISFGDFEVLLISLTAGGFIYISAADLIPELHREINVPVSAMQVFGILLGIGFMFALIMLE